MLINLWVVKNSMYKNMGILRIFLRISLVNSPMFTMRNHGRKKLSWDPFHL